LQRWNVPRGLFGVRADDDRDVRERTGLESIERRCRERDAVDVCAPHLTERGDARKSRRLDGEHICERQRTQACSDISISGATRRGDPRIRHVAAEHRRAAERARAALHDRTAHEPVRRGRTEHRAGAHRTRRLAEQCHAIGIATERGDVVRDPAERVDLIEQSVVARDAAWIVCIEARIGEIAERTEPIVDRHDDDAVRPREVTTIVQRIVARPRRVTAAVDEHHHRMRTAALRRPDIERQAVLVTDDDGTCFTLELRADRPERICEQRLRPARWVRRRPLRRAAPTAHTRRRRCPRPPKCHRS